MFWYIVLGVSIIMLIISIVFQCVFYDGWWRIGIACTTIVILFLLPIGIIYPLNYRAEIDSFRREKQYIEQVVPTLPDSDNVAITHKRIELNEWLYKTQYNYRNYHFFNFIPEEIMDLEEIK